MTPSTVTLVGIMIGKIRGPINQAFNFYENYAETKISIEKIHDFLMSEES